MAYRSFAPRLLSPVASQVGRWIARPMPGNVLGLHLNGGSPSDTWDLLLRTRVLAGSRVTYFQTSKKVGLVLS